MIFGEYSCISTDTSSNFSGSGSIHALILFVNSSVSILFPLEPGITEILPPLIEIDASTALILTCPLT